MSPVVSRRRVGTCECHPQCDAPTYETTYENVHTQRGTTQRYTDRRDYAVGHKVSMNGSDLVDAAPLRDFILKYKKARKLTWFQMAGRVGVHKDTLRALIYQKRVTKKRAKHILANLSDTVVIPHKPSAKEEELSRRHDLRNHRQKYRDQERGGGLGTYVGTHRQIRELLFAKPREWMEKAACRDVADPEIFFPPRGGSGREALEICHDCPVKNACHNYAMTTPKEYGIWAGKGETERRTARMERRTA